MVRAGPDRDPSRPRAAVESSLWRALVVFRFLALVYAIVRFGISAGKYAHPAWPAGVIVLMIAWTGFSIWAYQRVVVKTQARQAVMVVADVAVAVCAVLSTVLVDTRAQVGAGGITLPTVWSSAPVLACAIAFGWRGGLTGALAIGLADFLERGAFTVDAFHNLALMMLAGCAVGYVTELGRKAERTFVRAQRLEAATRERQRLSRDIHDGVLQVLALVQRRGAEIGGAGAELGRMAGEQELALRSLVNSWHAVEDGGRQPADDPVELDLCALLGQVAVTSADSAGPRVTLSSPGEPVTLPSPAAREVTAAVLAALDNVRIHGGPGADGKGARAWILVEDDVDAVLVTVRDDGPGIPAGRLEEARLAGRLGVAQSIEGRLRDAGGSVGVVSVPGQGTEVELRIPRQRVPPVRAARVSRASRVAASGRNS